MIVSRNFSLFLAFKEAAAPLFSYRLYHKRIGQVLDPPMSGSSRGIISSFYTANGALGEKLAG